ncbi:ATP-binding protein [Spirilliplanes yamanashiensis]|uniref:LuxR family transcriptional regulator n=1 Tax=Spirilliplanes yamanashiensis TaxID=42233 RepID=A0A8J3YDT3_9ACTN|nr:AAA family ATPase [Spirilliplanes yamanashiensis]MDP9816583.1 DNA-binding CsgD family transcriptional regulator/tetratricopeptide (TPR) repeat protein [Spirilliplanes yamanashiensis]GIJ06110.1 LuxR family transcriptional regulator [Spirilliplanes yamanashiensis]
MELLERADALGLLDDLLGAHDGGRVAVVGGEAGAGKSTLVGAFTQRVRARARVLWGACDPLLTPRALGPLHDIARDVGGALAERIGDAEGAGRGAVFDALLDALDAPRRRSVVVLEDLHWADEATLDLVTFLGRRLARCKVLLIVTYRDDEVGPEHPLRAVLAGLPRGMTRRLPVAPLSAEATAELARRAGREAAGVYEVTGGNPLLVSEVLAAASAGVPATVRDLVLSRLAALSPAARDAAGLVAVVPTRAEAGLIGDVAAVEECLAGGVLVPAGDGVAFRHELLRRAVEEALSPVRRAALHARVLVALGDRADPARLVHHAHHAGDTDAVLRWVPVAARRAQAVAAHRQAAAHYALALPLTLGAPAAQRAELLEAYAFAAYLAGLGGEALGARREALALRAAGDDAEKLGEAWRWLSRMCWWTGHPAEARQAAARAVEVLETLPPGRPLAAAYSNLSQLRMLGGDLDAAIHWGGQALALAHRLGDTAVEAHALTNVGSARMLGGDPEGVADLERAHVLAVSAGLDDDAGRALVNLATFLADRAGADPTDELERALAFTTARDLDGYTRHLLGYRAELRLARGDWAGAQADAEQAVAGADQPGASRVRATAVLGVLRSRRGEPGALDLLTRAADRGWEAGEIQFVGPASAALAEHHWLAGDPAAAADEARRAYDLAVRSGIGQYAGELAVWLWRAGGSPEAPYTLGEPYRLLVGGNWRAAADHWEQRGHPYPMALALACGDTAAAARALRIVERLGAVATARRLRAQLRERGVAVRGPRPATVANPSGLTARQVEVVALLADGLSNAEIAARLSLSAKTVDHHVSAVLAKLGVATRGQAAATARKLGLVPPT